ncbi:MAG: S9 family peptidase [Candidatus Dormibacteraceae bacterium]
MTTAPYGSWKSPITADLIVGTSVGLSGLLVDGPDLYWSEMRPSEGGRLVVVRRGRDGGTADVTPPGYNTRTRVHEYGGAAFAVSAGVLWFSNYNDQRLYRLDPGGVPRPITGTVDRRYADAVVDRGRGLLFAVREDHTDPSREAVNTLVRMGLDGEDETVVAGGADFYSNPRLSPDGSQLAWLQWNHPNLPWDGTELWVAGVDTTGGLLEPERVPAAADDALCQPEWSPAGVLHFVSDRTGWWNLYRWQAGAIEAILPMAAEFGSPQWVFGLSDYTFLPDARIVARYVGEEGGRLIVIDGTQTRELAGEYASFSYVRAGEGGVYCLAGSPTQPPQVLWVSLEGGNPEVIRRSFEITVDPSYFSIPQAIEFPTEGGRTAFAIFYPPHNPEFQAPDGELPPLVVHSHGGPTSAFGTGLNLSTQYWTSRGVGVVEVNYGGSTGYGTEYRRRLNGEWGIVDVDDCVNAARDLVARNQADGHRVAIAGGSAGGYTTLAALTTRDFFSAGADHFGLSDLIPFAEETHKFESRYLDSLIGPYPERADLYRERSPMTHVANLSCPLIVFQGLEDKVVPPNQSEFIVDAARRKGLPVAYVAFEGEQHGFRKAENIKRALDGELYFYSQVFDFALADEVEPVEIENL